MTYARAQFRHAAGHRRGCNGRCQPDLVDPAATVSNKPLDRISNYARHGYAMSVECLSCGHSAKIDARAISDLAIKRNLSCDIAAIEWRLRCQKCGKRDVRCGPTFG